MLLSTLNEHFFVRTNQYIYLEFKTLGRMQKPARKMWDEVAKKGPQCAKAVQMLKDFNKSMGR